eukprot:SAG22_NODE_54_length_23787_cov_12.917511_18_plen_214_part_00
MSPASVAGIIGGPSSRPWLPCFPAAAAAPGGCARTILLKGGVHSLNETMQIGKADSGLCISGAAGEHATLSGGMELPLTWVKHGSAGVYVAALPAGTPRFDQLFVAGRREVSTKALSFLVLPLARVVSTKPAPGLVVRFVFKIRAKYPNGDPETTGLHTVDTGYISEGSWSSKLARQAPLPETETDTVTLTSPRSKRAAPDFPDFKMTFGCPR